MTTATKGNLYIGTSNIVLPGTKKTFPVAYQSGSRLTYYASLFNTVELNSSFYKVPLPATFEKWSNEVPDHFKFTVKLWRNITHAKKLDFTVSDIDFFMQAANQVTNSKKGFLLIQFPKSITVAYSRKVSALLKRVQQADPKRHWQIGIEFRDPGWYNTAIYDMLEKHRASLVLHDMPGSALNLLHTKVPSVYLRFHGVKGDYKGSYEQTVLEEYAAAIRPWLKAGKDVYAYFNNTIGDAFNNAQQLAALC